MRDPETGLPIDSYDEVLGEQDVDPDALMHKREIVDPHDYGQVSFEDLQAMNNDAIFQGDYDYRLDDLPLQIDKLDALPLHQKTKELARIAL
jgi:hypothetical protein